MTDPALSPAVLTIDRLCISPFNVRKNAEDCDRTRPLEASIEAVGLIFPLIVHRLDPALEAEHGAPWGVLAGGRRFRAITRLVEAGRLPADWPVRVDARDLSPAELTELSLAENLPRLELRDYEVDAAVALAVDQGAVPDDIAENIGQRPEWVRRRIRLGKLAPQIFAAYAAGEISLDQAQAFGATADVELQAAAWAHFAPLAAYLRRPEAIRAWLRFGDYEFDKLLRFVGEEIYRAAGGRFELDLFADEADQRGAVRDEGKLRELAENRLAHERQRLRLATGKLDLQFLAAPPEHAGRADHSLSIEPVCHTAGGEQRIDLPAGDVAALLRIADDGEVEVSWWWASRKAQAAATKTPAATKTAGASKAAAPGDIAGGDAMDTVHHYGSAAQARAAVKEEHGLTADGLQVMRSLRRALLRAALIEDANARGTLGRDYLVWSQLRQELTADGTVQTGARGLSTGWNGSEDAEPTQFVRPFLDDTAAEGVWLRSVVAMRAHPAFAAERPEQGLAAFLDAEEGFRNLAASVLAGFAVLRSANVPGWRVAAHDLLARRAGAADRTLRKWWVPTARFMGLFPKLKRLELAQPFVEREAFASWHRRDDRILAAACAAAASGEAQAPGDLRDRAAAWVHPLLSFEAEAGAAS